MSVGEYLRSMEIVFCFLHVLEDAKLQATIENIDRIYEEIWG
jgi:hypothetical protein